MRLDVVTPVSPSIKFNILYIRERNEQENKKRGQRSNRERRGEK